MNRNRSSQIVFATLAGVALLALPAVASASLIDGYENPSATAGNNGFFIQAWDVTSSEVSFEYEGGSGGNCTYAQYHYQINGGSWTSYQRFSGSYASISGIPANSVVEVEAQYANGFALFGDGNACIYTSWTTPVHFNVQTEGASAAIGGSADAPVQICLNQGALSGETTNCLTIDGGNPANGVQLTSSAGVSSAASAGQDWYQTSDGLIHSATNPGYCLDLSAGQPGNDYSLEVWSCDEGGAASFAQQWDFVQSATVAGEAVGTIIKDGYCVGSSAQSGGTIELQSCSSSQQAEQTWAVIPDQ